MKKIIIFSILFSALPAILPAQKNAEIPTGWRAYALETDAVTAKNAAPGDLVDVLMGFDAIMKSTGKKEFIVATILQKVRVLDIARAEGKSGLVLQVTPSDAQYLLLAENENTKVIFRRRDDMNIGVMPVATFNELFR